MQLILVRHGETPWTISGRHTGVTDLELTEQGREQAASLGPLLSYLLHDRTPVIYASPRRRSIDTMRLALPRHEPHIEPLIAEYDYGDYEGQTYEQIRQSRPDWNIWRDGCPGGESTDEVAQRADTFLEARVVGVDQPVIVFSHGHFTRILLARALGIDASDGERFDISPASVSTVQERRGKPCIGVWNVSAELLTACYPAP